MILAIDTGNTHIVLGCIDEKGEISHIIRLETNLKKTEYEYASETEYEYASDIKQILELENVDRFAFTDAVISSSVPQLIETLRRAVKIISGIDAMVVGAGVKTGLDIVLDDPGTIAADLVATAVAAKNAYPLPCIIIDMGTATTVTVVDNVPASQHRDHASAEDDRVQHDRLHEVRYYLRIGRRPGRHSGSLH